MKNASKRELHDEFQHPARETTYEISFYLNTDDGLELFETIHTESPPALPNEGEHISFDWIEDSDENEVTDPVHETDIGSDEPYTVLTSTDFEITSIKTSYSKRTLRRDDAPETATTQDPTPHDRLLTIKKTVILTPPM